MKGDIRTLIAAINDKNVKEAKRLIEKRSFYINETVLYGEYSNVTPLWLSLYKEQFKTAKTLLEHGADATIFPSKADSAIPSTLWLSIYYKQPGIAKCVIEQVLDLNANPFSEFNPPDCRPNDQTPFWLALKNQMFDVAKLLIFKGADVFRYPEMQDAPLSIIIIFDRIDILAILNFRKIINMKFNEVALLNSTIGAQMRKYAKTVINALKLFYNTREQIKKLTYTFNNYSFSTICPITHRIINQPVIILEKGKERIDLFLFEQNAIEEWFKRSKTNPLTRRKCKESHDLWSLPGFTNFVRSKTSKFCNIKYKIGTIVSKTEDEPSSKYKPLTDKVLDDIRNPKTNKNLCALL